MEKQGKKRKEQNVEQIGDNNRGGMQEKKQTNKQKTRKERQKEIRKRNGGVGGINAESRSLDFLPEAPPPLPDPSVDPSWR